MVLSFHILEKYRLLYRKEQFVLMNYALRLDYSFHFTIEYY